jgi:hypothetical protein
MSDDLGEKLSTTRATGAHSTILISLARSDRSWRGRRCHRNCHQWNPTQGALAHSTALHAMNAQLWTT